MIPKLTFPVLLLSIAVRSEHPEESLRLNVPLWDVGDLYSRISNAFGAVSSTPAPQGSNTSGPWGDYYTALLQEYYNKKQGLYSPNSASEVIPVEPLPLPIPVPVPFPRPPRPLRPLRPQRPTRPWPRPTRKPTRRPMTTRSPTTTTERTTTTRSTTTASPISSSSSSTSTTSVPTTTEAINSTTIEPSSNSTASESSTTGGSTTTGGSSTTGFFPSSTIISSSKYLPISTPKINVQATTSNPVYPHQSQLQQTPIRSPTVLSLEGSSPGELRPEQKLTVQSPPQSMTSLCHNYPRLCAKPEEAQYVRLTNGFGKPMLLILPGAVEEHSLPIVDSINSMQRPIRSRPYRRRNPPRSRYVYRLIKKRNKQRL
ncbi:hypothetical protein KR038_005728 [Drosophila bunnanda]|nr:hypothetical protein KR038_005728 [Drosophila bunnanda]